MNGMRVMSRQPGDNPPLVKLGTIVARNYLAQAQVFRASVAAVHPEIDFTTLLVDGIEEDREISGLGTVILLEDLGIDAAVLDVKKTIYDVMEFSVSLKPTMLAFLLSQGAEVAAYFDPDIFMYSRIDDLFAETLTSGISITPHAVTPFPTDDRLVTERLLMWAGIYNAGFMAVSAAGLPVVEWWEDRLKTHGIADPENALYADQRWVDWVPALADPHIERGLGFNVAHWNLHERPITLGDAGPLAGGEVLRFLHFSGYDPARPWLLSTHTSVNPRVLLSENSALQALCDDYGSLLIEAGHPELRKSAYGHGVLSTGFRLSLEIRRFVRKAIIGEVVGATLPPSPFESPAQFENWLHVRQFGTRFEPLSALELAFWFGRADLAGAFPDPLGHSASAYRLWFEHDDSARDWQNAIASPAYKNLPPVEEQVEHTPVPSSSWAVVSTAPMGSNQAQPARELVQALIDSGRHTTILDAGSYVAGDNVTDSPFPALNASTDVNVVTVFSADAPYPTGDTAASPRNRHIAFVTSSPAQISPAMLQALTAYNQVWAVSEWTATWLHELQRIPVRRVVLPVSSNVAHARVGSSPGPRFRIAINSTNPGWRSSLDDAISAYLFAFPSPADAMLQVEDRGLTVEAREQVELISISRSDVALVARDADYDAGTILLVLEPSQGVDSSTAEAVLSGIPAIVVDHPGCTEYISREDAAYLIALRSVAEDSTQKPAGWPGCDRPALSAAMRASTTEASVIHERASSAASVLQDRRFAVGSPREGARVDTGWILLGDTTEDDTSVESAVNEIRVRTNADITAVSHLRGAPSGLASVNSVAPVFAGEDERPTADLDSRLARVVDAADGNRNALELGDTTWDLINEVAASRAVVIVAGDDSSEPRLSVLYEWAALGAIASSKKKPLILVGRFDHAQPAGRGSDLLGALLHSAKIVAVPDVASAHHIAALGAPAHAVYRVSEGQRSSWWDEITAWVSGFESDLEAVAAPPPASPSSSLLDTQPVDSAFFTAANDTISSPEMDLPVTSDHKPVPLLDEYAAQIEVLEQALFERERYAASVARALFEAQTEAARRVADQSAEREATLASAEHRVAQAEAEKNRVIADLKNSTSWKVSLPVRVMRHPVRYLRIARNR